MRIGTVVLSVFLIVYVLFQLQRYSGSSYSYQTVYTTTVENTIPVTGIFFRDEEDISVSQSGVLSCNFRIGQKVPIDSEVARLYKSQEAIDLQREILSLEDTLQSLQKAQESANTSEVILPETLNSQIAQDVSKLIQARDVDDLTGLADYRTSLTEAFAKRQIIIDADTDFTGEIASLEEQLFFLIQRDNASYTSYTSDVSGYFVDHVDGYEDICTDEYLEELTASELDKLIQQYGGYNADSSHVKVVTNHIWQFVLTVTEEQALSLSEGSSVQVRFPNQTDTIKMVVSEMRRDVDAGEYMVILEGDIIDSYLLTTRVQSCELVVGTYTGLKVPKSAIRYEEGIPGVYVVLMDKMYFRTINVVYETEDFVVSSATADQSNPLKLYDTIIVEGVGLYNQKNV